MLERVMSARLNRPQYYRPHKAPFLSLNAAIAGMDMARTHRTRLTAVGSLTTRPALDAAIDLDTASSFRDVLDAGVNEMPEIVSRDPLFAQMSASRGCMSQRMAGGESVVTAAFREGDVADSWRAVISQTHRFFSICFGAVLTRLICIAAMTMSSHLFMLRAPGRRPVSMLFSSRHGQLGRDRESLRRHPANRLSRQDRSYEGTASRRCRMIAKRVFSMIAVNDLRQRSERDRPSSCALGVKTERVAGKSWDDHDCVTN
ncbi:hypothetical protein PG991_012455 [Apiospora marii]|uniref:Uncharacterized protein n=1 Tax=Apiospora marii TaxID=335849 RepID=A0ABR1RBQ1_9PEZI